MSLPFDANERVLCYHGPLVYEAKVLKADTWDETNTKTSSVGPHFFVHYKGWKQTWDEWVPASRLLKFNEQNLALQKQLNASAKEASASAASTSKASKVGVGRDGGRLSTLGRKEGARGTKRGRDEDDNTRKPDLKLNVPDILKAKLVDDWEAVTKNGQLVTLPRSPNVEEILGEFRTYVLSLPKQPLKPQTLLPTVTSGLKLYFDKSIGTNLLYRFERPQYAEQRKKFVTGQTVKIPEQKEMSAVYGAEHLLRMIVNLPSMVANSTMDQESVHILREYVQELMNFLVVDRDRLFQAEYETASAQYQNLSRS